MTNSPRHSWMERVRRRGPSLATCSDISKRLLRLSDISICPPGKRDGEGLRVTASQDRPCAGLHCARARARCFVFHLGSVTWKISSKGRQEAGGWRGGARQRQLMDLYQAVKTDKCHSSLGRLQVNPDQRGVGHTQHTTPSMPQCHLDAFSQLEHDDRSAGFGDFCLSSSTYDVIVANKRSNQAF